jgi:hypothetical protein
LLDQRRLARKTENYDLSSLWCINYYFNMFYYYGNVCVFFQLLFK